MLKLGLQVAYLNNEELVSIREYPVDDGRLPEAVILDDLVLQVVYLLFLLQYCLACNSKRVMLLAEGLILVKVNLLLQCAWSIQIKKLIV